VGHFITAKTSLFLTRNRGRDKKKGCTILGCAAKGMTAKKYSGHSTIIPPRADDFNRKLKRG
jgi:hypothetical protein